MYPYVTARLANDPEKAWGCPSALDGALGPALGTELCAQRASGSPSRQPRPSPLSAMMEPNDASSAPQMQINRPAILAARKNATR